LFHAEATGVERELVQKTLSS